MTDKEKVEFGKRLSAARKKAKDSNGKPYTASSLSEKFGFQPQTIYAYESGKKLPSTQTLIELAKVLSVSLDKLFGLENRDKEPETMMDVISAVNYLEDFEMHGSSIETITTPFEENKPCVCIRIFNPKIVQFFERNSKMLNLCLDGTIDRSLYDSWLEGELERASNTSLSDLIDEEK